MRRASFPMWAKARSLTWRGRAAPCSRCSPPLLVPDFASLMNGLKELHRLRLAQRLQRDPRERQVSAQVGELGGQAAGSVPSPHCGSCPAAAPGRHA